MRHMKDIKTFEATQREIFCKFKYRFLHKERVDSGFTNYSYIPNKMR